MSYNYHTVASYLSSSEINRCKRNNLQWYVSKTPFQWIEAFKQKWIPRKLRRKLYTLYTLDILPVIQQEYVVGVGMENPNLFTELAQAFAQKYLEAEDETILKGLGK